MTVEYYLKEGTIFKKRYRVVEPLGRGGFGLTYLCADFYTGAQVAVKEFFPREAERNGSNVEPITERLKEVYYEKLFSFSEEFRIINSIEDSHVVKALDFFTENNTAYYVMEYVDGMNLKEYLSEKDNLDHAEVFQIMIGSLQGLASIHRKGYVHGDLKPTNIMLTRNSKIKIMDFGAACLKDIFYWNLSTKVGSLSYTCPEKFFTSSVPKNAWDIYSMGGIMYFLLSGKDPIPSNDRLKGIPLESSMITHKRTRAVIEKAMSLDFEKRYTTAEEFLRAINKRAFFFPFNS